MSTVHHTFLDNIVLDAERYFSLASPSACKPSKVKLIFKAMSPRLLPVTIYRLSRSMYLLNLKGIARFFTFINMLLFGVEISPQSEIGPGLFLPHTFGTVIGAYSIGKNAIIFQGVTIGSRSLDFGFEDSNRPKIGDDVLIGAGAKVLGNICIGNKVKIGANAVVVKSVKENSTVIGFPSDLKV